METAQIYLQGQASSNFHCAEIKYYQPKYFRVPMYIRSLPGITLPRLKIAEQVFQFYYNRKSEMFTSNEVMKINTGIKAGTTFTRGLKYFVNHRIFVVKTKYSSDGKRHRYIHLAPGVSLDDKPYSVEREVTKIPGITLQMLDLYQFLSFKIHSKKQYIGKDAYCYYSDKVLQEKLKISDLRDLKRYCTWLEKNDLIKRIKVDINGSLKRCFIKGNVQVNIVNNQSVTKLSTDNQYITESSLAGGSESSLAGGSESSLAGGSESSYNTSLAKRSIFKRSVFAARQEDKVIAQEEVRKENNITLIKSMIGDVTSSKRKEVALSEGGITMFNENDMHELERLLKSYAITLTPAQLKEVNAIIKAQRVSMEVIQISLKQIKGAHNIYNPIAMFMKIMREDSGVYKIPRTTGLNLQKSDSVVSNISNRVKVERFKKSNPTLFKETSGIAFDAWRNNLTDQQIKNILKLRSKDKCNSQIQEICLKDCFMEKWVNSKECQELVKHYD